MANLINIAALASEDVLYSVLGRPLPRELNPVAKAVGRYGDEGGFEIHTDGTVSFVVWDRSMVEAVMALSRTLKGYRVVQTSSPHSVKGPGEEPPSRHYGIITFVPKSPALKNRIQRSIPRETIFDEGQYVENLRKYIAQIDRGEDVGYRVFEAYPELILMFPEQARKYNIQEGSDLSSPEGLEWGTDYEYIGGMRS